MLNIPRELIWDILLRLQPKDLIRYRCVSKAWYALIHNQDFIKPHLERSIKTNSTRTIFLSTTPSYFFSLPFDNDEKLGTATTVGFSIPSKDPVRETTVTVGYANGLVCICNYVDEDISYIALWNPSIQKLKKIPIRTHEPRAQPSPKSEMLDIYGFGYNSTNDDYKLVGIIRKPANEYEVSVYSLKANSWKRIQNMPCSGFSLQNNHMVFSKGALGWLMWKKLHHELQYMIVTLDLASEKYREFPFPVDRIDEIENSRLELDALGDYLCICVNRFMNRCEAWIMKEYGVTESWSLLYSIDTVYSIDMLYAAEFQTYKPVVFSKNGKTVLLKMSKYFESDSLVWYDLEKKSFKQVEISGLPDAFNFQPTICWGSLCLLDGDPVIV
ncbi:F-box protein CPR30 [Prunus yedoensis var. nudiflora]|uniref:F-box protein CPR30 n=1 Tax=Prunus yedoensis var. nudiflora TaxID=2094558 RepID=A0A314XRD0_PRUYE|nr:F-box protein CPR30 [Prunus yedoensis var. nudiflora]